MILLAGGERHDARVVDRDAHGAVTVAIDGQEVHLALERLAPETFRVRIGDRTETLRVVADGDVVYVFWSGRSYTLRRATAVSRPAAAAAGALEAPMPGRVVQVAVAPGDAVVRGQVLLVIEAMKMENAVRAPRDGRVVKVEVAAGSRVVPGQRLVELS
jgi:biotin carboxyl carrier protein